MLSNLKEIKKANGTRIFIISKCTHRIGLGQSFDLKINGTLSYYPYPNLIDIENKDEFNYQYTTKTVQ